MKERTIKTYWKERRSPYWAFFCPLCRTPHRVRFRPQPGGAKHVAQVGLTSMIVMWSLSPWMGWKGILSFLPLWTAFEVIYRIKVREALHCDQCGFDPYLYLVDRKVARREVEAFWRKKFEDKGLPYPGKETS